MCSVLGAISALATAAGGYMQYQAQQDAAEAQARNYERQAEIATQNAKIKNRQQEQEADNAARETEQLRQRQRVIRAQNIAKFGAAGLSGTTGSPLDILNASNDAYEQDKETSLMNQRNRNYGLRVEENNFLNDAAGYRAAADNTRDAAKSAGLATILGTAASIAGNFAGFGGGGGSSSGTTGASGAGAGSSFSSPAISSKVGTNTTATWSMGTGYTFNPTKTYNSSLYKTNYFSYR